MKSETRKSWGLGVIYVLLLGFSVLFLFGCSNTSSTSGTTNNAQGPSSTASSQNATQQGQEATAQTVPPTANIGVDALEAAITANPSLQLVDVREPREYASGHIKMAINRPLADLEKEILLLSKDKEIVVIDLNGTRAVAAWNLFVKNGFDQNKIKVLSDGMMGWRGIVSSAGSTSGANGEAPKAEVQEVKGGC